MPAAASDPLFAAFGAAVRTLRMRRGLTQEALAERAQLHRTYLTDVELGRRNVSLYNIGRLAAALEVPMAELIGDAEARAARGDPTPL
jgi:transcriptional regulator with XRE-family HTH domain